MRQRFFLGLIFFGCFALIAWIASAGGPAFGPPVTSGTITVSDDENANDNQEVVFTTDNSNLESDGDFHYNPSTGTVTATEFSGGGGSLTGVDAATGDSATAFFDAGVIEVARGGTGADESGLTEILAFQNGTKSGVTESDKFELIVANRAIGTDIQAWDAQLDDIADGTITGNFGLDGTLTVNNGGSIALASGGDITGISSIALNGVLTGLNNIVNVSECEGFTDDSGVTSATVFTDSGESFTVDSFIGMTIYNTTDGSSGTVIDNSGTTIEVSSLSGGTNNYFSDGDAAALGPGPYQSGTMFFIDAATTILHPATAGYVAGYFVAGAVVVKIDPQSASMTINFSDDGVYTDPGAGDEIDGDGTQGDFIVIINQSVTEAHSLGVNGSWADGGAS